MADSGMKGAWYRRTSDQAQVNVLFNELSGFHLEFLSNDGKENSDMASTWETGSWVKISEGMAKVIERSLAAVRTGK